MTAATARSNVESASSVILAAAVFHEHLARSPRLLALQLVGGVIAAAVIAVLSRSPVVLVEDRRQSPSAGFTSATNTVQKLSPEQHVLHDVRRMV